MGRVRNSVNYQSVNRNALTFDLNGLSTVINTALEQPPGQAQKELQDLSTLETQQQSANNIAFLWKLLNCAVCDLKKLIEENKREDICHAYGFQFATPFNVPNITDYTIPFFYLKYQPTHGTFTTGEFTAGLAGYYDVDVRLSDIDGTKTPGECWLRINGTDCDRIAVTGQLFELQGSMKVYCNPGDKIKASLYQNSGVDMPFYAIAAPAPIGYLSISYCGSRDPQYEIDK